MQQLHAQPSVHLLPGDFRKLVYQLRSDSIDLVLTDLPYPRAYLPLWTDAAREMKRVLKPAGFFISYSGQRYLPEVLARLGEHLEYYWCGFVVHQQGYLRSDVGLVTWGKPLVLFQKPPRRNPPTAFLDVLPGGGREKSFHSWQQSLSEAKALVQGFCPAGGWVLDPCCGSGTTLAAAAECGRNSIGFELNQESYDRARERLERGAFVLAT